MSKQLTGFKIQAILKIFNKMIKQSVWALVKVIGFKQLSDTSDQTIERKSRNKVSEQEIRIGIYVDSH